MIKCTHFKENTLKFDKCLQAYNHHNKQNIMFSRDLTTSLSYSESSFLLPQSRVATGPFSLLWIDTFQPQLSSNTVWKVGLCGEPECCTLPCRDFSSISGALPIKCQWTSPFTSSVVTTEMSIARMPPWEQNCMHPRTTAYYKITPPVLEIEKWMACPLVLWPAFLCSL